VRAVAERQTVTLAGVRRWGEDETTPIAIDTRAACGTWSDHQQRGCIAVQLDNGRGTTSLVHLTTDDALRLSDLLRAMAGVTR
jgi:hypothetical protein